MPHDASSSRYLLGKLVAGQESMQKQITDFIETSRKADDDHDERITSLEQDRSRTVGWAAGISAALSGLGLWIGWK